MRLKRLNSKLSQAPMYYDQRYAMGDTEWATPANWRQFPQSTPIWRHPAQWINHFTRAIVGFSLAIIEQPNRRGAVGLSGNDNASGTQRRRN